jgi:hypothetical protein
MKAVFLAGFLCIFSPAALRAQEISLPCCTARPVTVQKGDTVSSLLRSSRIKLDGSSLAAVFALNPDLEQLSPLRPGSTIVLPIPKDPEAVVSLELVPEVKRDLLAVSESLNDLVEPLGALPAARFGTPDEKEEVIGALDEIRGYLDEINLIAKENRLPLGPELLRQSLAEMRAVQQLLEGVTRRKKAWDRQSRALIVGVSEDLNLKARSFDEIRGGEGAVRWREVDVVVDVRRPGLRVFYVNQRFKDRPDWIRPFPGAGSQVQEKLLEGDYLVWAAETGKTAPATEKIPVQVRKQGRKAIEVDLPAKP